MLFQYILPHLYYKKILNSEIKIFQPQHLAAILTDTYCRGKKKDQNT